MSNNGPVGDSGGVNVHPSPYSNGAPDNTGKTGQTNDQRKVKVRPDTGQTHIPDKPEDTPPPSPLSKRKVARHDDDNKLKPMPDGGGRYKPLGSKATPSDSPQNTQRRNPQTGQPDTPPALKPKVTVESPDALKPLQPLTPEQQEQKSKLAEAFSTALGFIRQHKNSFAMGGGAALMIVGITLMAFPPTAAIGILPAVLGFTMVTTGFSFAMMNMADSPSSPTPPPEQPKNENKEEDDKKKKDNPDEPTSSTPPPTTPKGHFAKIDHTTGASELTETEETSAEEMAKKKELLNLQRHMEAEIRAAFQEDGEAHAVSGSKTTDSSLSTSLEEKLLNIAAEYAVRAGLNATDDVLVKIVESGKVLAAAMANMEGMTLQERQEAFQSSFVSLVQNQDIPEDAVRLLCAGFDSILAEQKESLTEAAKAILSSTSALLKAIVDNQISPQSSVPPNTSKPPVISLAELEAALEDVHNPDKDVTNIVHMRQLKDAIELQGRTAGMASQDVEQVKRRLFVDALDLLNESKSKDEFSAALAAKVDPVNRKDDREFLDKALQGHKWFRSNAT